jgi:hypothetical protein
MAGWPLPQLPPEARWQVRAVRPRAVPIVPRTPGHLALPRGSPPGDCYIKRIANYNLQYDGPGGSLPEGSKDGLAGPRRETPPNPA